MNTTIKIDTETRKKLKLLAVLLDKTMIEVMDQLVDEALKKVRTNADAKSVYASLVPK